MCGFSEIEIVRLSRLRDRFHAREWSPAIDGLTLTERLGVSLTTVPLGVGNGGVIRYRCIPRRDNPQGERRFEASFQVMPAHPFPPDADELLSWLAGCVANCALTGDLSSWALLYGFTADGRVHSRPYRGLFHEEADMGAFVVGQQRKAAALREFLGPSGFTGLMQEVAQAM